MSFHHKNTCLVEVHLEVQLCLLAVQETLQVRHYIRSPVILPQMGPIFHQW